MDKPKDVKITVLKRLSNDDLIKEYADPEVEFQCPVYQEGQEFISKDMGMPENFCAWAWADIQRDVAILGLGGDAFWISKKGIMISACTDGLRPVIFKLERIE